MRGHGQSSAAGPAQVTDRTASCALEIVNMGADCPAERKEDIQNYKMRAAAAAQ